MKIRTGAITTHVQRLPAAVRAVRADDPGLQGKLGELGRPAEQGEPPVVVFVHGLLTDSLASYYFTLGPAFAAEGIDVIMYDLRGHGRSERPQTGYRLESFVDDLAGLLDALGETRRVHVVGNSFGGTIAAAAAAWHPDRIATVTMIESEPPVAEWTGHMADGLADAKNRLAHEEVISWIKANHGAHTARLSRGASRILQTTTLAEDVPAGRIIDDDLSAIGCPLLAIFGDESGLSAQVPALEAKLDRCRTVILPDQGHSVLVERTADTRDLLLAWIREHELAGAVR